LALVALGALAQADERIALVSPTTAAITPALVGSVGRAESTNNRAQVQVAGPSAPKATSASYRIDALYVGAPLPLGPTPPYVVAFAPGGAPAAGGATTGLLGLNFAAPGVGPLTAHFGASSAPATTVSNLVAVATAPAGLNNFGNPLGAVKGGVSSTSGPGLGSPRFAHFPALVQRNPASVGGQLGFDLHTAPGALAGVYLGSPIPGIAVPIAPFSGALELVTNLLPLVGFAPVPGGSATYQFPLPPNPNLAGVTLNLQGLALVGALGSFTNNLSIAILP